jgi:hypothetical protein
MTGARLTLPIIGSSADWMTRVAMGGAALGSVPAKGGGMGQELGAAFSSPRRRYLIGELAASPREAERENRRKKVPMIDRSGSSEASHRRPEPGGVSVSCCLPHPSIA